MDLSDPGIKLGSLALQAYSLPTELLGKPYQAVGGGSKTGRALYWFPMAAVTNYCKESRHSLQPQKTELSNLVII